MRSIQLIKLLVLFASTLSILTCIISTPNAAYSLLSSNRMQKNINGVVNFLVPPQFIDAKIFSEGFAPVKVGNLWGYIDISGNLFLIPDIILLITFLKG